MGRLTAAHASEFRTLKALCYAGLESAQLRQRVGDRLSRHLGVASYCFGANDPATALPVHSISVGLDPSAIREFFGLVLATPSLDFGPWAGRACRAARLEDVVEDVDRDPYMTQILRPAGLRYDVQVACTAGGWSWGHLCLRRTERAGPFAPHDVRFLAALAPHLTCGLRAAGSRAALAATPGTTTGVVVLGPDGRVELANGVAERLFRQPVSGTRHSFLSGVNIVAARLERALDGDHEGDLPELMITDEASRATYRVRAERVLGADGRARGLVLIEPATSPSETHQVRALARYGLTRRECEVAVAVVRGGTVAQIATELVVSAHTVADHLRKVYDKLGVGSRQQLAMRLLGGA
jgi:DNA-binding CsgD family transcriptional regulator